MPTAVAGLRPFGLTNAVDDLFTFSYSSLEERRASAAMLEAVESYQRDVEKALQSADEITFSIDATCAMCGTYGPMITSYMYAAPSHEGRLVPNWREHLACACGFPNRVRASMHFLTATVDLPPWADIYVTEQVTPLYQWLAKRYPNLQGSEYLGPNVEPGAVINNVRHEDVCKLSFPEENFDLILSFDVLEHVSDFEAAIGHFARVLKPGGRLIFQAPTMADIHETLVRARVDANGVIEHLLPPEIHGNPVDPENGALCMRYLGVDTLDLLRSSGFSKVKLVQYWSRHYAYLGASQILFYAEK